MKPTYDHTDCDVPMMWPMRPMCIATALPGIFMPIVLTRRPAA
jgi:hypothetical protein